MNAPDLATFDVLLVNSSAGKDSQAMLDYVVELATAAGVRDRIVVVHADLGQVEWAGTRELAEEQARHYGVRFVVVQRTKGDLLAQVEARGMWPDNKNRYCTSDQKRDQVAKLITQLTNEHLGFYPRKIYGAVRVLNCLGLRAQESPARKKKAALKANKRASNRNRTVTDWLPIHTWSVEQVWARITASGVRHHRAYDLGMGRLSCCFCVFAPKAALVLAGIHNPELLDRYVELETKINHTFTKALSIASVREAVRSGAPVVADPRGLGLLVRSPAWRYPMDTEKLPNDEFSKALREAQNNPSAIEKTSMIDLVDMLGHSVTWIVKTIRTDGADVVFVQRINAAGGDRWVLPAEVTTAMARHRDGVITVSRKRGAFSAAVTRRAKKAVR